MNATIYKILNTTNGKCYIGSSNDFKRRKRQHLDELRKGVHHSNYLQKSFLKYGEDSFEFQVLTDCTIDKIVETEQHYIDTLKPEYNILKIAYSGQGYKVTEEMKQHLSMVNKGQVPWSKGRKGIFSQEMLKHLQEIQKHKREVQQLDSNTLEVLATFPSMTAALKSIGKGKTECSNIRRAVNKNQAAYGFKWRYTNGSR